MADVKRSLLVRVNSVARVCEILTGYGRIIGIDHEGTITYELEEKDDYELGRRSYEIEHELNAEFTGACIVSAIKKKGKETT
jgi:hypothetical protein